MTAVWDAGSGTIPGYVALTAGFSQQKIYWEATMNGTSQASAENLIGAMAADVGQNYMGAAAGSVGLNEQKTFYNNASGSTDSSLPTPVDGDRVCYAIDGESGEVWAGYITSSGTVRTWHGGGNPATDTTPTDTITDFQDGLICPAVTPYRDGGDIDIHVQESDFAMDPPAGFEPLRYAAEASGGGLITHPGMTGGISG